MTDGSAEAKVEKIAGLSAWVVCLVVSVLLAYPLLRQWLGLL